MISFKQLCEIYKNRFEDESKDNEHSNHVFKSCLRKYIIVLKKCHDTITNEARDSVVDKNMAKFRADILHVLLIIDLEDGSTDTTEIINTYWDDKWIQRRTVYTVGLDVEPDSFDQNINRICSNGIHYFNSLERAYYYDRYWVNYTGPHKRWHENGAIHYRGSLIDGKRSGLYEEWQEDGTLKQEWYY